MPIAADGQGTRQSSPLITAFVLGLAATGGGLLLSTVEEAGLGAVSGTGCDCIAWTCRLCWLCWLCGWAGAHKLQLNAPWRHGHCQCGALATPMHSMLIVWWLPPCSHHLQVKSGEAGAALSATSVLGLDEQTKALLTVRTPLPLCCG